MLESKIRGVVIVAVTLLSCLKIQQLSQANGTSPVDVECRVKDQPFGSYCLPQSLL